MEWEQMEQPFIQPEAFEEKPDLENLLSAARALVWPVPVEGRVASDITYCIMMLYYDMI